MKKSKRKKRMIVKWISSNIKQYVEVVKILKMRIRKSLRKKGAISNPSTVISQRDNRMKKNNGRKEGLRNRKVHI